MTTPPIPPDQAPEPEEAASEEATAEEATQPVEPVAAPEPPIAELPQPPAVVPQPPVAAPPPPQPPTQGPPPAYAPPPQSWSAPAPPVGPAPGVRYAGHGARFLAYLVDGFIAGLLIWVIMIVLGMITAIIVATGSETASVLAIVFTTAAVFVVSLAYFPWFWMHGGQTPGMRVLRLRVVRAVDGGPLGGGQAVIRLIGLWISFMVFYLGVIWILFDAKRQGWHDKIAGTVVIEVN